MKPVAGKVISGYGPKADGLHNDGVNIKAAAGDAVRAADESKTAVGGSGGLTYKTSTFSIHGSGYYCKGISTTLMFNGNSQSGGELTKSYGYYGQLTFTPANSKATFAGSFGSSFLKDDGDTFKTENSLISGGIYYQATKSLKIVGEGDYMWSKDKEGSGKNKAFTGAFGMMLFY